MNLRVERWGVDCDSRYLCSFLLRYEHIESVLHLAIPSGELLPKNIIDSLPNS